MSVRRLLLLSIPMFTVGCVSDDTAGPAPEDAGLFDQTTPTYDSSFADANVQDVATADQSTDAPADSGQAPVEAGQDAAVAPVAITVTGALGPEPGVTIVFQNGAGAVLSSATTNASGTASQIVPAGSQVTAVLGTATNPLLLTIVGVEPGDALTAVDTSTFLAWQASIDSVPASPPDAGPDGGLSFAANAGSCQTTFLTPPSSVSITPTCASGSTFPVLVVAENASFSPIGFAFQKGNALPVDGGVAHVAVGGAWSTATTTQTVSAINVPATFSPEVLAFSEIAGGVAYPVTSSYPLADDAGAQAAPFTAHTGYADAVQAEANVFAGFTTGAAYGAMAVRGAPPTADGTTSLDLSQLLPQITTATIDSTTTPSQPQLTWTSSASLATLTQGTVTNMTWSGSVPDSGAPVNGSWTIVAPPSATSVQAPVLPSAVSAWAPIPGAAYDTPVVVSVDATFFTGYPQFRAASAAFPPSSINFGQSIVPPLPANGTVLVTAFATNPS